MRQARKRRIKPYPAEVERAIDPADKLGLQELLGAGSFQVLYLRGRVSFQKEKTKPDVREGKLPESKIIIRKIAPNIVEYKFGSVDPKDSVIKPQSEVLDDIASGLGLDKLQALNVSIKERLLLHKTKHLPKELQENELIAASEDLHHYQSSAGDFTEIVSRSLRLPYGFLRSPRVHIRNELITKGLVKKEDPILPRIKSVLRTYTLESDVASTQELLPIMGSIHKSLTRPFWWQDVAVPTPIMIDKGITPSIHAQLYQLYKTGYYAVIQLPRGSF